MISSSSTRYAPLLAGRDGMIPPPTGLERHCLSLAPHRPRPKLVERWVQLADAPGSPLAGWHPDVFAAARNYEYLPAVPALWALSMSAEAFVALGAQLTPETTFLHGDWGAGTVADGTRWLGHESVHHLLDVDARASNRPT